MRLDFQVLDLHLVHRWAIARTAPTECIPVVIVQLASEDGVTGCGEAAPVIRYRESTKSVETFCRKVDFKKMSFDDLEKSVSYIRTLSTGDNSARCAFSVALFDGAAKRAGKSLHDFLGLGFSENRYVTSFTIGLDTPAIIAQKVLAAADYPILKMKAGVREDARNLESLRVAAPTKPLRIDANEGWKSKEEALRMIEFFAQDGRVEFVEQPMPASMPLQDWHWLKQRSPLPIFGDESYHTAADAELAAECFHGVNVKLVKAGGIAEAVEALRAARRAGLKTMLGCMIETSILISAAAHLAELCDYLDLDGNLLVTNDPYSGVIANRGVLSFASAREKSGLRVSLRT